MRNLWTVIKGFFTKSNNDLPFEKLDVVTNKMVTLGDGTLRAKFTDLGSGSGALKVDTSGTSLTTSGGITNILQIGSQTTTLRALKTTAGNLYHYTLYNPNSTSVCVEFFNATTANVTLGTTTPYWHITLGPLVTANFEFKTPLSFSTAITMAVVTAYNGSTAPSTGIDVCIGYN